MNESRTNSMPDDRFDAHLRRLLELDSGRIPGAPSQAEMFDRLGPAIGVAGSYRGKSAGAPLARVVLVLALLGALVAGAIAVGSWMTDRNRVVVGPTELPALRSPVPTNWMPFRSAAPLPAALCPGGTRVTDILDTDQPDNLTPNWVSAPPPGDGRTPGSAWVALQVSDAWRYGSRAVELVDLTTGAHCLLVELPDFYGVAQMAWSPSGDALAIAATLDGGPGMVLVWSAVGITRPVTAAWGEIDWAPDGSALSLSEANVEVIHEDGSARQLLLCEIAPGQTPVILFGDPPGAGHYCPVVPWVSWSPDGTQIALSGGDRCCGGLFSVASLADRQMRRLETGLSQVGIILGWLDAGNVLATDFDTLYRVPVDNPRAYEVVGRYPDAGRQRMELSPDLGSAAAIPSELEGDLRVTNIGTGATSTVLRRAELGAGLWIYRFGWSPDGRSLVVSVTDAPYAETDQGTDARRPIPGLWVVNADGTGLRKAATVEVYPADGTFVAWRPVWP